jgi:hypothetical protein
MTTQVEQCKQRYVNEGANTQVPTSAHRHRHTDTHTHRHEDWRVQVTNQENRRQKGRPRERKSSRERERVHTHTHTHTHECARVQGFEREHAVEIGGLDHTHTACGRRANGSPKSVPERVTFDAESEMRKAGGIHGGWNRHTRGCGCIRRTLALRGAQGHIEGEFEAQCVFVASTVLQAEHCGVADRSRVHTHPCVVHLD